MRALSVMLAAAVLLAVAPFPASALAQPTPFEKLAAECAPDVAATTLKAVVQVESGYNPFAIGVVGGRLARQPRSLAEAVDTAKALERQGFNFSVGLGQVNRYNLAKYGESYGTAFDPCRNLKAGSAILRDCYERAKARIDGEQAALRAAFSCYYAGNFRRGFQAEGNGPSYVQKVVASASGEAKPIPVVPAIKPGEGEGVSTAVMQRTLRRTAVKSNGSLDHRSQWVTFIDAPATAPVAPLPKAVAPTDGAREHDAPFVIFVK